MTTLYGIKNCDTVRKAMKWLESHGINYQFHDFRVDGLTASQLKKWSQTVGWESLLNKRSTSWRNIDETVKASINESSALKLMLETPTLIKRPVLENNQHVVVGFSDKTYQAEFK